MINTEWGIKQVMRSPIALVLFSVLIGVIVVLVRVVVVLSNKIDVYQTQIIICKEQAAQIIRETKDESISMLRQLRAEQDSSAIAIRRAMQQVQAVKRKRK